MTSSRSIASLRSLTSRSPSPPSTTPLPPPPPPAPPLSLSTVLFGPTGNPMYIRPSVSVDESVITHLTEDGDIDDFGQSGTSGKNGRPPLGPPPSTSTSAEAKTDPSTTEAEAKTDPSISPSPTAPPPPGGNPTPSPHHQIALQDLRRLTAAGICEDESHRPLAWRILLRYLPLDTALWQSSLDRDRTLYRNLVQELFAFSEEEPFEREGAVLRGMGWKRREQTTRRGRRRKSEERERRRSERSLRSLEVPKVVGRTPEVKGGKGRRGRDRRRKKNVPPPPPPPSATRPLHHSASLSSTTSTIESGVEVLNLNSPYSSSSDSDSDDDFFGKEENHSPNHQHSQNRPITSITTDEQKRRALNRAISAVSTHHPPSSDEDDTSNTNPRYTPQQRARLGLSLRHDQSQSSLGGISHSLSMEEEEEAERLEKMIPQRVKEEWRRTGRDVQSLIHGLSVRRDGKRMGGRGAVGRGGLRYLNALLVPEDDDGEGGGGAGCNVGNPLSPRRGSLGTAGGGGEEGGGDEEEMDERWQVIFENASLLDEIRKDVVRTHPDLRFFLEAQDNVGMRRYAAIERILFVWAKLNKGVRYVQGMNEIVGTMYFVLANDTNAAWAREAEADTYYLFNTLMVEMRDIFVPDLDDADTGIQGRMSHMLALLSLHDPEVRCHLDDCGIDPSFYSIRWLTTLLSREFYLPDTIRLWDSMFASTHKDNFMRYVCVSMVMIIRENLLKGDFGSCLRLLQKYPPTDVDDLLESSRALWIYESQVTLACHKGGISLPQALTTIAPPPAVLMAYGLPGGMALDEVERLRRSRAGGGGGSGGGGGGERGNSPASNHTSPKRNRIGGGQRRVTVAGSMASSMASSVVSVVSGRTSPGGVVVGAGSPGSSPRSGGKKGRRGSFGSVASVGSMGSRSLLGSLFGLGGGRRRGSKR